MAQPTNILNTSEFTKLIDASSEKFFYLKTWEINLEKVDRGSEREI